MCNLPQLWYIYTVKAAVSAAQLGPALWELLLAACHIPLLCDCVRPTSGNAADMKWTGSGPMGDRIAGFRVTDDVFSLKGTRKRISPVWTPAVMTTGVQTSFAVMRLRAWAFVRDVAHNKQLACTEWPRLRRIQQIIIIEVQRC